MKIKTSELTGAALDWAVALAIGEYKPVAVPAYSTDWSHGGPIIDREGISWHCGNKASWHAYGYGSPDNFHGHTPLIAAMRCFVASKIGHEVTIPDDLL